jgi:hypothetical protein
MTFQQDLKRGIDVELMVLHNVKQKYPAASLINGYKGYDIWVPEKGYGIEVKYDPMSNQTGNFVLEFEYNNKLSALLTTTAKYWVFYDDESFLWIKPCNIFHCIFNSKKTYSSFVGNGDKATKKAFLIPKSYLIDYADKVCDD